MKYFLFSVLVLSLVAGASAQVNPTLVVLGFGDTYLDSVNSQIDECMSVSYVTDGELTYGFNTENTCVVNSTSSVVGIVYDQPLELTYGAIQEGEIQSGENWFYVDSLVRPDLDVPATLVFQKHRFLVPPIPKRNGFDCDGGLCNLTYFSDSEVNLDVGGFSNYSLTARQDFTVYSDPEPELKDKTYQTVDLGNGNRSTDFACIVQLFGRNEVSQWVLIQTNPERAVQGRLFGSPDTNQPESLGYFPTKNGIANTYFRGNDNIYAYNDLEMLIQCSSNQTVYYYEEAINTRYSPLGRAAVSRGIWLTDGANAVYVIFYAFGGLILLWVLLLVFRRTFRRY